MDGLAERRYEIKYRLSRDELEAVELWLKLHPLGIVAEYPNRTVHNIYFDTYQFDTYADMREGNWDKHKVRYRWYDAEDGKGQLEIKHKAHQLGWKTAMPVSGLPPLTRITWRQWKGALMACLPETGQLWLKMNPNVVVMNHYHRRYFCAMERRLRLTLDTDLAYTPQFNRPFPDLMEKTALSDRAILEIKCPEAMVEAVLPLLQSCPIPKSGFSKYALAFSEFAG